MPRNEIRTGEAGACEAPRVAVVMTCYNEGRWLEQAVASVLDQTAAARIAEIVILDDGSGTETLEILRRVSTWDPRIRVLFRSGNGLSKARNIAIRETASPLVAILDSDDYWAPTKLEKQLSLLDGDRAIGLAYTGFHLFEDGLPATSRAVAVHDHANARDLTRAYFLKDPPIIPSTIVFRRNAFEACGAFDEEIRVFEDTDFYLRLSRVTGFAAVPEPLIHKRMHARSITSRRGDLMLHHALVAFRFAQREPRLLPFVGRRLAERARKLANLEAAEGHREAAARLYRLSLSLWPWSASAWGALAAQRIGGEKLIRRLRASKLLRSVR